MGSALVLTLLAHLGSVMEPVPGASRAIHWLTVCACSRVIRDPETMAASHGIGIGRFVWSAQEDLS